LAQRPADFCVESRRTGFTKSISTKSDEDEDEDEDVDEDDEESPTYPL
jgi:hypothetical protein